MRADLYHVETRRIAAHQGALLDGTHARLLVAQQLKPLGATKEDTRGSSRTIRMIRQNKEISPRCARRNDRRRAAFGPHGYHTDVIPNVGEESRGSWQAFSPHPGRPCRHAVPIDLLMAPRTDETI